MDQHAKISRRRALGQQIGAVATIAGLCHRPASAVDEKSSATSLEHQIGIVSASANSQLLGKATGRNFTLLELPKILRDELDMRIIDLNTLSFANFGSVENSFFEKFRDAVADADCILTNLKMNQRGLDMNSPKKDIRNKALAEYKRSIDIAALLGCRWVRPIPGREQPDMAIHVASYRELCDYAAEKNVMLLVENFGWMQHDAGSVVDLVRKVGRNVAAGVDIGNWSGNAVRYDALRRSFPHAVTCDFKARRFGPNGEHSEYDLRRCFDIAWDCGFRGPWAIEHLHPDTKVLFEGLSRIRDMLGEWTREKLKAAR